MERFSWDDGNYLEWADQERLVREDLDRIQELRKQGMKRRRNMDKLRLQIEQRPGEIHLNFDEIEKRLDERLVEYKGAVFTEESKSIAKAEVAELRKLKKDIDEARKTVKREWMKPYESFELRVKKLIEKVDEPISFIDDQVKAFERKRKEEKRELIEKLYYEVLITYTEYEDYIQLNIIYDPKWENASTSIKTIKDALKEKMEAIKTAVISIKAMNSDITEDALLLYKNTLDLNKAIQKISSYEQNKAEVLRREEARKQQEEERRRQEEINRAKAAERETMAREAEIRKEVVSEKDDIDKRLESEDIPDIPDDNLPFTQPDTITAFYRVVATEEELEQVKMTLNSFGVYFERRDA